MGALPNKQPEYIEPSGRECKKSMTLRGSTGKSRVFIAELHDAIRRAETKRGQRLVDHLVEMAFEDKQVLLAVARKILPDLKHVEAVQHTETDITIRWDVGDASARESLPNDSTPSLTQTDASGVMLPPPASDDQSSPTPASEITLSKEGLTEQIEKAERSGRIESLEAVYEEVHDDSDETDIDG